MALTPRPSRRPAHALPQRRPTTFPFRNTTAHVASRRLALAELPIEAPVEAGDTPIELDRMVLGLAAGQPIALTGERADLPGVEAAEIAFLADIVHADGRTTLLLRAGARRTRYVRDKPAHQRQRRACDARRDASTRCSATATRRSPNQSFVLKQAAATYVPVGADAERRREHARSARQRRALGRGAVALRRWRRTSQSTRRASTTTRRCTLTFGDGVQRRAAADRHASNVTARYRSGIGPDGEVDAGTLTMLRAMPLGLRGVTNALPASGAEGPEQLADARRNAPLTLLTFERVVSLLDYENYARAFPGIGKARGDVLWIDGASLRLPDGRRRDRRRAGRRRADQPRASRSQARATRRSASRSRAFAQRYFSARAHASRSIRATSSPTCRRRSQRRCSRRSASRRATSASR